MGMFDSVIIKVKCPFCGQTSEMECQTKQLDCKLYQWKLGENTGHPEEMELDCYATCSSAICIARNKAKSGKEWGNEQSFDIIVETPFGLVTGKYRIDRTTNLLEEELQA